jgi:hypothetical protein
MRKAILLTALFLGAAMLAGTPAKADIGCACVKFGQAPMCLPTMNDCVSKRGGLCLAICHIEPRAQKKMAKRKAKPEG